MTAARRGRIAQIAPPPTASAAPTPAATRVLTTLRDEYNAHHLTSCPNFLVVLEGTTDLTYLRRAARLVEDATGDRPLAVPDAQRQGTHDQIALLVPGTPGALGGGTERMTLLARDVFRDVFAGDVMQIAFVFDDDWAGRKAERDIANFGFKPGVHSLTLSRQAHPGACPCRDPERAGTVIEDLLPLTVQTRFFARGGASCDAEYQAGTLTRYRWYHPSKRDLSRYVAEHATVGELSEVVRLLSRIRRLFGFPS